MAFVPLLDCQWSANLYRSLRTACQGPQAPSLLRSLSLLTECHLTSRLCTLFHPVSSYHRPSTTSLCHCLPPLSRPRSTCHAPTRRTMLISSPSSTGRPLLVTPLSSTSGSGNHRLQLPLSDTYSTSMISCRIPRWSYRFLICFSRFPSPLRISPFSSCIPHLASLFLVLWRPLRD
jgi:hypothetical protein